MTADMLKAMVGCWARATFARSQIAGCLVAFADFLRCNELIKLKCSDIIIINAEGMVINVQYRENASLVIARTGSVTCPVSMMERYFHMGKLDRRSHGMLFRAIVWTKEGESLRKAGGLSYSRLRELLLDKIAKFGFDPALFGMHSLHARGATAAANAGVQDKAI